MTDQHTDTIRVKKRLSTPKKAAIVAVLLAAVAAVIVPGLDILTKRVVVQELQNIADRAAANAKPNGARATFTYDEVKMEGNPFARRAIVIRPTFEYSHPTMMGIEEKSTVTTASAVVTSDSVKQRNFSITLPDPINISADGQPRYTVTFELPPVANTSLVAVEGRTLTRQQLNVPGKTTITAIKAKKDGGDNVIEVAFDADHTIMVQASDDGKFSESTLKLSNLVLSTDGESIDTASLQFTTTEKPGTDGAQVFDTKFSLSDFGYKTATREGGPYNFNLKMNGEYTLANADTNTAAKTKTTVEELSLNAKEYGVKISGTVERQASDPLPFGSADVVVTNFAAVRDQKIFGEKFTPMVADALALVAAQPAADLTDITFKISRESMGTVTVGQTTFEQLTGLVMTQMAAAAASASTADENTAPTDSPKKEGSTEPPSATPTPVTPDASAPPAPEAPAVTDAPAAAPVSPATPATPAPAAR